MAGEHVLQTEPTTEQIRAAADVLWREAMPPFGARVSDCPDLVALRAADAEAQRLNDDLVRRALIAAFRVL